jgi:glycosyltransferase involved in cell wall biosynthesis
MSLNPSVSVVVTTYNQAGYIEQAVESVLAQTYAPHEVIVVDDGSTDDTSLRIASYTDRVSYIRQRNRGVAGSRNTGICEARGELIAFLDGDDIWDPEKLALQVGLARTYPNSGLLVVDGVEFDESGITRMSLLSGDDWEGIPENEIVTGNYHRRLLERQFISTTSQVMVPARVFDAVGLSNGKFPRANDWDLYIRIAARFDVTILKKPLMRWRYLHTSASGPRSMRELSYLPEEVAILRNHLRQTHGDDRAFFRRIIEARVAEGAEELYYFGLRADKTFATRLLLKLLAMRSNSRTVIAFLAGLWSPPWITRKLSRAARKITVRNSV